MRLTAFFLLCFMLASFTATCSDDCDDEHEVEAYEWVFHNADEHHADFCTPFCGCNCCPTLSAASFEANLADSDDYYLTLTGYYLNPPDPRVKAIWQPPKI